jgi:RNA polymerase sigma-70 factor (ECF subfamily)
MRERGIAPVINHFAGLRARVTMNASHEGVMDQAADDREWGVLLAAAQDGDGAAYARLLKGILPLLRAQVRRRVSDADRAEDVVQEALLSLHRHRHTYDPALPFRPWLWTIAERRIADALRGHYRREARETPIDPEIETLADDAANMSGKDHMPLAGGEGLRQAIARLPPKQRAAIELLKLKEMTLKEASAATGMSIPALKVNTHRAIRNLRGLLAPSAAAGTGLDGSGP